MHSVRFGLISVALLLLVPVPVARIHADEEPPVERPPARDPTEAMTEVEREAVLPRARELNIRAATLFAEGRYPEAIALAREVLAIYEKAHGPVHAFVAASLNNLGVMMKTAGQLQVAQTYYERALQTWEQVYGPDHPRVAEGLNNLGALLRDRGLYEEARALITRSLRIREEALGAEHVDVAESLGSLAELHRALGEYARALSLHERALRIRAKRLGSESRVVAASMNNVAVVLRAMGDYDAACAHVERATQIMERALGPNHPEVAGCLGNLASVLEAMGRFNAARALYERALRIKESTLGPEHPDLALSLHNLAAWLCAQGLYDQARPLYERALAICEKAFGSEHPRVASSLSSLGGVVSKMGEHETAYALHERALRIRESVLGSEHPSVAEGLNNLAVQLAALGRHAEACPLSERALSISEKALGFEHPDLASYLGNLAHFLSKAGQGERAGKLYERALRIREGTLGPEHLAVAGLLNNLACLFEDAGRYDEASPIRLRSLAIIELNLRRCFSGLQASERLALSRSLRQNLGYWLLLAPHVGRTGWAEVLRFKGIVARAMAAERRLAREGGAGDRVAALRAAERRLAGLANAMPPKFQKAKHRAWRQAYLQAGAEREEVALALARTSAPYREGLERLDLTRLDIRDRLGPDDVLVDFLRSRDGYLAWVVSRDGGVTRVNLGDADAIEEAAAAFATAAAGRDRDAGDTEWETAARAFHERAWAPIERELGEGVRTIYLCPDAALATVPFAALPGKDAARRLLDDYVLVNLGMAQDLVPWKDEPQRGRGAVAIGYVDYEAASSGPSAKDEPKPPRKVATERAPRGGNFLPLPQTKGEVAFICERFGADCAVLLGSDATEARLRATSKGKRILHLATHGFVRDDLMRGLQPLKGEERVWMGADLERQLAAGHDPLSLAGLALAGANPRKGGHGDDGILTALEATHLDLDGVELVVLSACETALGKAESGEGVIGLVQGFQVAGAKRVVASLWQVDDAATRLLMQHLYDAMLRENDPLPPAEALREAAIAVRDHVMRVPDQTHTSRLGRPIYTHERPYAHPRYWAAFVAYGR